MPSALIAKEIAKKEERSTAFVGAAYFKGSDVKFKWTDIDTWKARVLYLDYTLSVELLSKLSLISVAPRYIYIYIIVNPPCSTMSKFN